MKFTVIIPVKNRANYLTHTLRTCSIQEYQNLDIIVSDDGSTDNLREIVQEASRKDPRIKYVSPNNGKGVGMRDNFEFALSFVKEGYVIALGGDDGLLPNSISKMAKILEETKLKVLSWASPIFIYPGAGIDTGQLILYTQLGRLKKGYTVLSSKDFLERQAIQLSYSSDIYSPMFYVKGVVSIDLINLIKSRTGDNRFYVCPTPDGFSGIAIAGEIDSYVFSYEPLSIFGLSPSSQGMNYLSEKTNAIEHSQSFFKNVANIPMHKDLASQPYSPLIALMTADYLLTAMDLPGWPGKFPQINFKNLLLKCIDELSHGLYSENRLHRELKILHEIAVMHGLDSFLQENLQHRKRHSKKKPIEGNAIAINRIFMDCNQYDIHDIYDAAYTVNIMYKIFPNFSFRSFISAIINSLRYKFQSTKKGNKFPEKEEWVNTVIN